MVKTRERWIDVCKGVAILFVVMGHVVTSYHNSNLLTDAGGINFICDFIYSFHMPLFFVISGYLASRSNGSKTVKQQIAKKVISYGIPYLVFSVGIWLLKFVASPFVNSKVELNDLLMIFLYPINAMWFLYALLFISIIHICVGKASVVRTGDKENSRKNALSTQNVAIAFVILIISKAMKFLNVLNIAAFNGLFIFDVLEYYFYYEFGAYILKRVFDAVSNLFGSGSEERVGGGWLVGLFPALVTYIGLFYVCWINDISDIVLNVAFALAGTLLICSFVKRVGSSKLFELLGKQSLPIYLLHGYIISATRIVISAMGIPLFNGYLPLVLCSVSSIGLSLVAYKICGHIKVLDFCFYPSKYIV